MPAFFFQAEDGIRDLYVTGVQTCALPICTSARGRPARSRDLSSDLAGLPLADVRVRVAGPSRLQRAPGDDAAGRLDEGSELVQRVVAIEARARKIHTDEVGALRRRFGLDHAVPSKTYSAGPASSKVLGPGRTKRSPPGTRTVTRADRLCSHDAAATVAHAPVPHASVSPTPRSSTRKRIRSFATTRATSTFASPAAARASAASAGRSTLAGAETKGTTCGLPKLTRYARAPFSAKCCGELGAANVIAMPASSLRAVTVPPGNARSSASPPWRSRR